MTQGFLTKQREENAAKAAEAPIETEHHEEGHSEEAPH
jgi:hypothetical protein